MQLADTLNPELIYPEYIYITSISPGLVAHFAKYADHIIKRIRPRTGAWVVDIGSNDGTLLRHFKKRGMSVRGIDPAESIARMATNSGIPTQCGFFGSRLADEIRAVTIPADIITANHIMANVADLHDFAKGIKTLLADNGTFVFETGYWPAIRDRMLIDTIEHEHIHYFAVKPLAQFFQLHGLRLVAVEEQPTKGGSLRGYVRHLGSGQPDFDDSVEEFIAREDRMPNAPDWPRVHTPVKGAGEQWVGYGAAVGSTLLLHHYYGIGPMLTELWDDNAGRHGLYSPGLHLPVKPPNSSNPDKIVILAWRYAEMIMAKHPEHQGKWIIPLPTLRYA